MWNFSFYLLMFYCLLQMMLCFNLYWVMLICMRVKNENYFVDSYFKWTFQQWWEKIEALKRATERETSQSADVIYCTCVGARDPQFENFRFRQVDILVLAMYNFHIANHFLHCSVIMCKKAARAGLALPLFEHLVLLGVKPIRLHIVPNFLFFLFWALVVPYVFLSTFF